MNTRKEPKSVLYEQAFKTILDKRFIKTDDMAAILSIAIQSNENVLIWGDPGYGKSEMTAYVINSILGKKYCQPTCKEEHGEEGCESPECGRDNTYIMGFGESISEDKIWGGLDMLALNDTGEILFKPERSFLNYEVAILEEMLDAPPNVLMSLKDTLTARELRNGEQKFKMKTRCVIGLTNKDPEEISDLGASARALIERFPLQFNLNWDTHTAGDYKKLFNKVKPQSLFNADAKASEKKQREAEKMKESMKSIKEQLANICALSFEKGNTISPRSAVKALNILQVNADRGDDAFRALRFIPGFEVSTEDMERDLYEMRIRREATDKIVAINMEFNDVQNVLYQADSMNEIGALMARLKDIDSRLETLVLPDELYDQRNTLRDDVKNHMKIAGEKLVDVASSTQYPADTQTSAVQTLEDTLTSDDILKEEESIEEDFDEVQENVPL